MATIVLTDYPWGDDGMERAILEAAGHRLVSGPVMPAIEADVYALVAEHDPQAIMTCWAQVSERSIASPTDLRHVQRVGVGLDNIAVATATARGSWVANVPDYCVGEVSDHAIAMLLDWARGTVAFDRDVKRGNWNPARARSRRVSTLTVGIIGLGRIARSMAAKLTVFGCTMLGHSPSMPDVPGVRVVPLEELLAASDVVVILAPLNEASHRLFDARRLAMMRPGSLLINVSRGPIIDNDALIDALERGHLSGAALDVIDGEPDPPRALADREDVIVTPHVAFSSEQSLAELRQRATEEVVRVLAGQAPHFACNDPAF